MKGWSVCNERIRIRLFPRGHIQRNKLDKKFEMADNLHPSLRNIVEQESLNWIFVGGKGKIQRSLLGNDPKLF